MISPLASPFRGGWRNLTPMRARGRGGVPWSAAYLPTLRYWLDQSAITDGMTSWVPAVDATSAGNASFAASTASPLALGYATPAVYFPGVASNTISCPDAPALDITGDIEMIARARFTFGATSSLLTKFLTTGNQRSFRFAISSTGQAAVIVSADGAASSINGTIAPSPAITENAWLWVKMNVDIDNGSGNAVFRCYTAADTGSNDVLPSSWTLVGTNATFTAIASTYSSSARLDIGSFNAGAFEPLNGRIGRMILNNGIDGPAVADFNATLCTQTGYTDAYGNVWSVGRPTTGRKLTVQSALASSAGGLVLSGTDDYGTGPVGAIPPCANSDSATMLAVIRPRATQSTGTVFSTRNGTGAGVTVRMASATTVVADVSDGTTTNTTPAVTFTPGLTTVVGVVLDAAGTAYCVSNNTVGSTAARPSGTQAGGALTFCAVSTPGNYLDAEAKSWFISMDDKISTADLARLVTFYGGGL